ncbi:MAG: methyltransferase domain-containing protein [Coriobacteriales bacterium]|nr:methyltransferase domain-containing protein [Coriobacteriales bacterium]
MNPIQSTELSESQRTVREHYGEVACHADQLNNSQAHHYSTTDQEALPVQACSASRGCGNPLTQAELREGERVLDLGCGGGIDVLLAAPQVGSSGHIYGLDMTPEMLELAKRNAVEGAVTNVSFISGFIENIPLPDGSVDVVTSNCVINLSDDKGAVLREAWRVLAPKGRFIVADMILEKPELPASMRKTAAFILGCTNDVLTIDEYANLMQKAGFVEVYIEPWHRTPWRSFETKANKHGQETLLAQLDPQQVHDALASAYIRGRKQ